MYNVIYTNNFKKQVKKVKSRGYDLDLLSNAVNKLRTDGCLGTEYNPHKLSGTFDGFWECHLKSDWLLVWQQNDKDLILIFTNTGTHSDIFDKKRRP